MSRQKAKTGSLAEMHDYLVREGYRYIVSRPEYDYTSRRGRSIGDEVIYGKNPDKLAILRLVKKGRPHTRVNIPLSPMMTQTGLHATPDTYRLRYGKERTTGVLS